MIAPVFLKRRADAVHPYPSIPVRELTDAQADEVQVVLCERYWGAQERAEWDAIFWRGGITKTQFVRSNVREELQAIRGSRRFIRSALSRPRRPSGSSHGAPGTQRRA